MLSNIPEVQILLKKVEESFNYKLKTSSDFECLSAEIMSKTKQHLSVSSLKRIWGYVKYDNIPRESTLDVLSKYIGHSGYFDFCNSNVGVAFNVSQFFSERIIYPNSLKAGATIVLLWYPDRSVVFVYYGGNKYKVISAINSKIRTGDECSISAIIEGHPLYMDSVVRDGQNLGSYVAGKNGGVIIDNITEKL